MFTVKTLKIIAYWLTCIYCYTAIIIGSAAFVGAILAPIIGKVLALDYTTHYLIHQGAWIGARYGGVWAGGSAIVCCMIHARKLYLQHKQLHPF
tara:strand:- start:106252 stop:106533 length:282 start_codon:yes stop_codon:yes gene_type:complete